MTLRLEYRDVAPDAVRALAGLNHYSDQCSISANLRRLVEILVSRINGCSYCIETHENQAIGLGEPPERVNALGDWQGAACFTTAEKAAFAWAQTVTEISHAGAPEHLYTQLKDHYSDIEIIDLTFVTLSMNAWNRLAISLGLIRLTSQSPSSTIISFPLCR